MRRLFGAFLGALLAVVLVACSSSGEKKGNAGGGTLVYARGADGSSMDPALATDGESYASTGNIYETLVTFKYGTTEIEPALATNWEISPDGLVYTLHLRQGVYFHTTDYWAKKVEFSAKDVLFSFKRQMQGSKFYPYYKQGHAYKYWTSMAMSEIIKDVEAPDDYTVKITLKHPEAPFLADLGMDFLSILSKDYADSLAATGRQDELIKKPIGTGPFKFVVWEKDEKVVLARNDAYWGTKAHLERVILRVIPNPSARALALEKGEVSLISAPNPNEVSRLEKLPNVIVDKAPALFTTWIALNMQKKPLDSKLVRQALNHAINTKEYIDVVYGGYAKPAINPLPPGMWGYDKSIQPYDYNPQKAKELLKKAGYPDGFEISIFSSAHYNKKGVELVQAQLEKVGITVHVEFLEWGTYLKRMGNGEHEMAFIGWQADTGDPDNFLYTLWSKHAALQVPTQNHSFYESDAYSDLVTKAKKISDQQERTKLYEQAQKIFHEDAPWIPLAYPYNIAPHLVSVKGYKVTGVSRNRFAYVYFEK